MARPVPVWTAEDRERAAKMLRDGFSASQMAPYFGMSRNAVIGRVHRDKQLREIGFLHHNGWNGINAVKQTKLAGVLAKPKEPKPTKVHGAGVASAVRARLVPAENRPAVAAERVLPSKPVSRRLTLMQLTPQTCKWPEGDPKASDFSFCGNEAIEGRAWCPYHARLAYAPPAHRSLARGAA